MASSDQPPLRQSSDIPPIRFGLRSLFVAVAVVACILGLYAAFVKPHVEHERLIRRFDVCIEQLTHKRPANLSRNQWSFMVSWTMNARWNCLPVQNYITDKPRFHRFVEELEHQIEGEVSVETVDWIWDEIEAVSVYGTMYSEKYRPTVPDHLNDADNVIPSIVVD